MEGFEKEARGGQARREPAAFRSRKKFRIEVRGPRKLAFRFSDEPLNGDFR
jgi:hypothetical protein